MFRTADPAAAHAQVVVGIDLGGTGSRFVAVDPKTGQVLARTTIPTPATGTPDQIVALLHEQITLVTHATPPLAIGIGASGPIDAAGIIRNPDTLPAFTGLPLLDLLSTVTDGPVVIDNDAVCAALAEHHAGAARHSSRSLHITLGTGVGVCLLNDGLPYRNHEGSHPEGGHIAVTIRTPHCYCGRSACWEQAASRQALQRAAARTLNRAPTDRTVMSELADRARRSDPAALAAFDLYGRGIADGLATLLTLYGPSIVVIGGSAADHLDLYRDTITKALQALEGWIPTHKIVQTTLDDYGGAIGGAHLASTALQDVA